jgi:hypothetical protein
LHKRKKRWCAKEQIGPKATSIDSVFIEELEENEVMEQQFVEA